MKKTNSHFILIRVRPSCTQVIQIKETDIISYSLYKSSADHILGSIYKGKAVKILPGMGACFLDIGLDKEVFLHTKNTASPETQIQQQLSTGRIILVQIIKNPIGSKSAQADMKISIAGAKLVYMPHEAGSVGVSKKIEDEEERQRLKTAVEKLQPQGKVIVRTKSQGASCFKRELKYLQQTWSQIKSNTRKTPGLVFSDIPAELQILRDGLSSKDIQVWIDDLNTYKSAKKFVKEILPEFKNQIQLYKDKTDLFEKWNISKQLKQALKRKVYLKSGGIIVFDETEALTVIDINTARYTGSSSQEKTILRTNLEAVQEIASQIRIRNLAGMIIIDLIDMELESSKEKVLQLFEEELKKDPVYTEIVSVSPLNLIQMTRKRTKKSLQKLICDSCPVCDGEGRIKSALSVAEEIFSMAVQQSQKSSKSLTKMEVICHPLVKDWIQDQESGYLKFLDKKHHIQLQFQAADQLHREEFQINALP